MRKLILIVFSIIAVQVAAQKNVTDVPSNNPGNIKLEGKKLTVTYDKKIILQGTIENEPSTFYLNQCTFEENGALSQTFSLTSSTDEKLSFSGTILGSEESFPCEAERHTKGAVVVRHTYGLSSSLLNRAVYDRKADWALSVDASYSSTNLRIVPKQISTTKNEFQIDITGEEIVFRFRPHYYQKHRNLKYFEPWAYKVWDKPVVGWCSWFAFLNSVTENDIKQTADVLQEKMVPFGLEYLQIDDGYQQMSAEPEKWTNPNSKFPSGMDGLADYISAKGMKPGLWTNVAFANKEYVSTHKNLFVTDANGAPISGRFINYIIDGSNAVALNQLVKPIYTTFRKMGWQYYKLDALRHLRYEGYNANAAYFTKKKIDRVEAFRNVVKTVRGEVGRENFLMGCWGVRPELIGLIDGCRIGDDGYGYQALTQYNSFNNIIWRNDPDHIELSEKEAYRSCMATSLTGSLFMLTDKPAIYNTEIIESARRTIPVLNTLPGQIFDVDPSCSDRLDHVNTDISGSGERAADANRTSPYELFLLEINKPFENWMVLGRTGEGSSEISFSDLGLSTENEYLVFEFWSKKYLGSFTGGFHFGSIDPKFNCQAFCIRKRLAHPQVLATSRHISAGGLELKEIKWEDNMLSGNSEIVAKDKYSIYISEPEGSNFKSFSCPGVEILANIKVGTVREITVVSDASKSIVWKILYEKSQRD